MRFLKQNLPLIILLILTAFLRLVNLGYSDYQGDEIKALFLPKENETFFTYILDQRKGPVQFAITYLLKFINPTYSNEFLIRLPFAIAGILSVYFFFKLVETHFGKKYAFFASFFLATNGFFVAFSRLVQYQSFVILFSILALYFFSLANKSKKFKNSGIYLGFVSWAISILSHYDGVFIAPFAIYLLFTWYKQNKESVKHLILSILLGGAILALFYIPFVLTLSESTISYWKGRVTGDVSGKISSSKYLFTVYQPIYIIHIYFILFFLGFFYSIYKFIKTKDFLIVALFLWILVSFVFMEIFVYIPGTHIYTYLLPLFIILAFGINLISNLFSLIKNKYIKKTFWIGICLVFSFIFLQSCAVFVDNIKEYPWEEENFLIWRFPNPTPMYHLSMFGFPYYRNWEGIRDFVKNNPEITAYSTNERQTISRYYVPLEKSSDEAGFYIHIKNPQSFTNDILSDKPAYWAEKYEPVFTVSKIYRDMVRIYIMPAGSLSEILKQGY